MPELYEWVLYVGMFVYVGGIVRILTPFQPTLEGALMQALMVVGWSVAAALGTIATASLIRPLQPTGGQNDCV